MDKAIEFANQLDCHVHFLFNLRAGLLPWGAKRKIEEKRKKIYELKERFRKKTGSRLKLFFQVRVDDVKNQIVTYACTNAIDMVLLDSYLNGSHFLDDNLDPGKLASYINCPVLAASHFPDVPPLKTIVLPVDRVVPVNKVRIAVCLAKQFDSSIHLVVLENDSSHHEMTCMQRVFELLKNNTDIPVACQTVQGKSLRDGALQYSQSMKDSLIVMNTGKESPATSFFDRLQFLFGSKHRTVPVMTVA